MNLSDTLLKKFVVFLIDFHPVLVFLYKQYKCCLLWILGLKAQETSFVCVCVCVHYIKLDLLPTGDNKEHTVVCET